MQGTRFELGFNGKKTYVSPVDLRIDITQSLLYKGIIA